MSELSGDRNRRLRVGSWWFHPEFNRLRDANSVVQLEPKASLALMLLVERAGQPVTRQELLDTVWHDAVVSDDALTQVIIKLRKALGDSSRDPRYIQTIPKCGYCLLAEVETGADAPDGQAKSAGQGAASRPLYLVPGAVLLVLLAAVVIGFLSVDDPQSLGSAPEPATDAPVAERVTLTVLPFEAITGSERERHFARGMRADLVTDLAGLSDVTIIRPLISEAMPVTARYQVHGDVQQVGERIGVHVRLIETASRQQIWSQRYERTLDDILRVQRTISHDVVERLALKVTTAERQRLANRYTPNLQAYEDFLRGQAALLLRQREANTAARGWYRQAIERDPNFARAYAGLALSYAADYRNRWVANGQEALRQAHEMAETGAQIDPGISEVYWVLGYVAAQNREHERALEYLRKALEADHSYADAYALMGGINTYIGRPELSIRQLRNAMRLNQDAGYLYYLLLGRAYYFTDRFEQATINLRESVARNPTNLETHIYLLATAVSRNDAEAADWEAEEIRVIEPDFSAEAWLQTYPMTDKAQLQVLAEVLAHAEM